VNKQVPCAKFKWLFRNAKFTIIAIMNIIITGPYMRSFERGAILRCSLGELTLFY